MDDSVTQQIDLELEVNGTTVRRSVEPRLLLSDFLRHELELTGTNIGCEHGVCGACTVLLDGLSVRACLLFAVQAQGRSIRTVESLATNGKLHPLQTAFHESHALQCGFCTPGMLMSLIPFLESNPTPDETEIREALAGNLCRCTGYQHIVDAVLRASGSTPPGAAGGEPE